MTDFKSSPPEIVGIVTVDRDEVCEGSVLALIDSLEPASVSVLVVCRDVDATTRRRLAALPGVADVVGIGSAGLSAARNAGLGRLAELGLPDDAIVSFPDDDCMYPPGLAGRVKHHFDHGADLVLGRYGLEDRDDVEPCAARRMTYGDVYTVGNSVGIFARYGVVRRAEGFDERLGVGSGEIEAAEDIEFLARCILTVGVDAVVDPGIMVRHPVRTAAVASRSGAYLAVAARYWRNVESWRRISRAAAGSLLGLSPIGRRRLIIALRPRCRRGWSQVAR